MVLLLLIPEKKREKDVSATHVSLIVLELGGKGLSIRAKALSVEIAVTDDMFLYVTGDCRRGIRIKWMFCTAQKLKEDPFFFFFFFLFSAVVDSPRADAGL